MAKKYKVDYTLVYTGGGKSRYATTILMESDSSSEAERKIRETNNLTSNVVEVQINRVILDQNILMAKLIRKEENIVYEYYEVEITDEQLELYKSDKEKFMDDFIWSDSFDFGNPIEIEYVDTVNTDYRLEDEPEF